MRPVKMVFVVGCGIALLWSLQAHSAFDAGSPAERLRSFNGAALRLAIEDLIREFGERYPDGPAYLQALDRYEMWVREMRDAASLSERGGLWGWHPNDPAVQARVDEILAFQRNALLANPLLDFRRLLLVKRSEANLGLPMNWESNSSISRDGIDNELCILSLDHLDADPVRLFKPEGGRFVGDVDLHFDGERMLFSMPGEDRRWQVFELGVDGTGLRQLPLIDEPDVDNYDACYLPDGALLFSSTACFVGVPCVTGSSHVSHLFRYEPETGAIRRLTFEQDHNWCPAVLNNGRVLYLRWEYSDLPHFVSRILFHMNPDGTNQAEYYGSNSYWPNGLFFARPAPNHPTLVAAIVSGHHDVPRMGELVLIDPARGRAQAGGVVQRIPGRGQPVEPVIRDGLVMNSWPKFLHPWPLSDKYLLVASKPAPESKWGIYLVDVFDNMTLLKEIDGYALLEPLPLRPAPRPPVIAPRVNLADPEATVYLTDVHGGPGLDGVPRGTVKRLRLFTYHFAYHNMGGQVNRVGLDGPWDIKRVLGTVPVESDGSALFRVPANTPISIQPLDAEGKALQLMRSWLVGMPGEVVSCAGCHEPQNVTPPARNTLAARRPPSPITPWYGPTRGFAFTREVQPVLDAYCIGCHDGREDRPDFRDAPPVHPPAGQEAYSTGSKFTPAYLALRAYVRTSTIESDMHLLTPCDFHADTSRLVRLLSNGHHGVELSPEAWDRLITWIDLNAPAHGTWHEIVGEELVNHQRDRRRELLKRYAGIDEDPEAIRELPVLADEPAAAPVPAAATPEPEAAPSGLPEPPLADAAAPGALRAIELAPGISLDLAFVPSGAVSPGSDAGHSPGRPVHGAAIPRGFWMSRHEITNEQFAVFEPTHDSRLEHGDFLQFSVEERGYPLNGPQQPVVRVSWEEAMRFCEWLARRTGEAVTLPSEAEWEHACRAGAPTPMWYGDAGADFAAFANLADARFSQIDTFAPWDLPSGALYPYRPAIHDVDDGFRVSAPAGSFEPNPWGLFDMHGNVAEWTRSAWRAGPGVAAGNGRDASDSLEKRVVRGGSWYDRPTGATAASRYAYHPWQKVYDTGFRVIVCPP